MPTWLVHGFRWPRSLIRIHVILQNLDDAAPEWLLAPATSAALLANFSVLYPDIMPSLPSLRFIEQYDPNDLVSKDQPYAYVCDQVHEVTLGVDVDDVRGKGVANEAWEALVELRDKIAPGEKVGWFVVVCGDVERWAPPFDESDEAESQISPNSQRSSTVRIEDDQDAVSTETKRPKGIKKWFRAKKSKRSPCSSRLSHYRNPAPKQSHRSVTKKSQW
ncbi:hypothetical protein EJ04DRAFT_28880 [Polyplosphaeria fusca]|uniref:Uncharacterized protein n=1 Tax=Polyplosphaeria fusca TaxID=682080 RepID=A0A9P4UZC4_9PLEO|nr:hypothetical protein EJ04DRAFT_28880 [Polyplosphaeria fusca]